jgi:signal transduction histidine kinase
VQVFDQGRLLGAHEQPLRRAADSGCEIGPLELELRSAGQPTRHVLVRALPLQGRAQHVRGAVAAVVDITDRKLAERERAALVEAAQAARQQAEAASQAKDEFLAMLGHELRNPLGAIASAVSILNRVDAATDAAVNARLIIGRQTRHLAHLMDDLLDVGRVISGKVRLAPQRFELGALIERVVATFEVTGQARGHDLRLALDQAWVEADATRIEQVVSNLLGNAFKYTPPGQRIDVTLHHRDGRALLDVSDHGPGIAPALLPRIFDLFVQGERPIDRPGGGLGIGLTLVRRLVELHGGEVSARSSPAGTSFLVCLPAVEAPPAQAPRAAEPARKAQRVLVVEDNADALSVLKTMLELDGHAVSTAADGERGLALLLGERPDVAIVDIGLPGLSGYEVALRSRRAGYAGKLFALSGYSGSQDVQQARRNGFDAHLAKPLDRQRLHALLAAS